MTHPTPRQLAQRLPDPRDVHRIALAIAALDVVLCSDWEERCFLFDPTWDDGEEYASMRNGAGDSYHIVFSDAGVVIRGFAHESDLSPWARDGGDVAPGVLDDFPPPLRYVIDEPAFNASDEDPDAALEELGRGEGWTDPPIELTCCFWCVAPDDVWCAGPVTDDGGAAELLAVVLHGGPDGYRDFARDYYEVELGAEVDAVYRHEPMTAAMIEAINPAADASDVLTELAEIGYPVG